MIIAITETKTGNNFEYNDSGMQSFWKLKVLEHILLKSNANGNLSLIQSAVSNDAYSFWNCSYNFCQKCVIVTSCQFLKFASSPESHGFG